MSSIQTFIQYVPPPPTGRPPVYLVQLFDDVSDRRFPFYDSVEIGRYDDSRAAVPGTLLVRDPTISSRHCVITRGTDRRCYLRDVSRNGVRVNNRRVVPNVEVSLKNGQVISFGNGQRFRVEMTSSAEPKFEAPAFGTEATDDITACTVLVGDIRGYTRLVQETTSAVLQHSINQVFDRLQKEVVRLGGTVKEYQGDAIFAFWEPGAGRDHAIRACRAALALNALSREMARDTSVWDVPEFPLMLDWALTTGAVALENIGGNHPTGLSMVGEAVVLAFRLEKLADDATGPILVCPDTRSLAGEAFTFNDLGERSAEGFERPVRVFSLLEEN